MHNIMNPRRCPNQSSKRKSSDAYQLDYFCSAIKSPYLWLTCAIIGFPQATLNQLSHCACRSQLIVQASHNVQMYSNQNSIRAGWRINILLLFLLSKHSSLTPACWLGLYCRWGYAKTMRRLLWNVSVPLPLSLSLTLSLCVCA